MTRVAIAVRLLTERGEWCPDDATITAAFETADRILRLARQTATATAWSASTTQWVWGTAE